MEQDILVVKIGGKIFENKSKLSITIQDLLKLLRGKKISNVIIIPGGGSMANFIRLAAKALNLTQTQSHWLAIFAMNFNGKKFFHNYHVDIIFDDDFTNLKSNLEDKLEKIFIFGPLSYLREIDILPHSWDVTSDSIAYFLAHQLNAKHCILIKDVDGIFVTNQKKPIINISTQELRTFKNEGLLERLSDNSIKYKDSSPIDSYLIDLIEEYKRDCILLNGTIKNRIFNYFSSYKKSIFTRIKSD